MTHPAASAEGIHKRFGATVALDGVDFAVAFGEIHASSVRTAPVNPL